MKFSEKMVKIRKERKLSQIEASKLLGIAKTSLCDYENSNLNKLPGFETIKKIARSYKVSYQYLLDEKCENEKLDHYDIGDMLNLSDHAIYNLEYYNNKEYSYMFNKFIENATDEFVAKLNIYYNIKQIKECCDKAIPKLSKWIEDNGDLIYDLEVNISKSIINSFGDIVKIFHSMPEFSYALSSLKEDFLNLNFLIENITIYYDILEESNYSQKRIKMLKQIKKLVETFPKELNYKFSVYKYELNNEFNKVIEQKITDVESWEYWYEDEEDDEDYDE